MTGDRLRIGYKDLSFSCEAPRVDVIESSGAGVLGTVTSLDRDYPIVTSNRYGEGTAIYVGLPAREEILGPIVDDLLGSLSISAGPRVPAGVMARNIDSRHVLYLNLDGRSKSIQLEGKARSILKDSDYTQEFELGPYQPDFVETK